MRSRIAVCAIAALALATAASGDGPLAHWRFDKLDNGIISDLTGNGHDATLSLAKGEPQSVAGPAGPAMAFTADQCAAFTVAKSADFNFAGPFTVMAWVKPAARNGTYELFCFKGDKSGDPPWPGWRIRYFWTMLGFEYGTPDGKEVRLTAEPGACEPGFWSHVAAVYDTKIVRLYVDGAQVAEGPATGAMAPQLASRQAVLCNYVGRKDAYPLDGAIGDIKVFSSALSAEDVYRAAVGG